MLEEGDLSKISGEYINKLIKKGREEYGKTNVLYDQTQILSVRVNDYSYERFIELCEELSFMPKKSVMAWLIELGLQKIEEDAKKNEDAKKSERS